MEYITYTQLDLINAKFDTDVHCLDMLTIATDVLYCVFFKC